MAGMYSDPVIPAVKDKVLELYEGDGIPDCVIDGIARRCGVGSNGKLVYAKPADDSDNEAFPVLQLMRLQDSRAVRPYLKGYMLRDAGLEALVRNMMCCTELLTEVAVKGFALGCAECYRVMGTLDEGLLGSHVGIWLAMHPQEPLGLLLQAHMKGGQRGEAWLVQQLLSLADRMPSPLLRAKVLATAANLQWELGQQADAVRSAEAALPLLPHNLDLLCLRAFCLHKLSGATSDNAPVKYLLPATDLADIQQKAKATQQAYEQYFALAAPEHPFKPGAHTHYALLLLCMCDVEYVSRWIAGGVSRQAAAAVAESAALTVLDVNAAADDPDQWKALLVMKQVMEEFIPRVDAACNAAATAESFVPAWYRVTEVTQNHLLESVRNRLEMLQMIVAVINQLEKERGWSAGSSSSRAAAAAGQQQSAGSSSSSRSRAAAAAPAAAGHRQSGSSSSSSLAAGACGSSAVPPATDEQLTAALLQLLEGADLDRVSYKQLHQQLEAKFQMDLSHKKSFSKQVLQDKFSNGTLQPQQQPSSAAAEAASATVQPQQQPGGSSSSSRRASQSAAGSAGDSSKCCKVCKAKQTKLMRCARCRAVKYCSAACQAEDWKTHKAVCVKKV